MEHPTSRDSAFWTTFGGRDSKNFANSTSAIIIVCERPSGNESTP